MLTWVNRVAPYSFVFIITYSNRSAFSIQYHQYHCPKVYWLLAVSIDTVSNKVNDWICKNYWVLKAFNYYKKLDDLKKFLISRFLGKLLFGIRSVQYEIRTSNWQVLYTGQYIKSSIVTKNTILIHSLISHWHYNAM